MPQCTDGWAEKSSYEKVIKESGPGSSFLAGFQLLSSLSHLHSLSRWAPSRKNSLPTTSRAPLHHAPSVPQDSTPRPGSLSQSTAPQGRDPPNTSKSHVADGEQGTNKQPSCHDTHPHKGRVVTGRAWPLQSDCPLLQCPFWDQLAQLK